MQSVSVHICARSKSRRSPLFTGNQRMRPCVLHAIKRFHRTRRSGVTRLEKSYMRPAKRQHRKRQCFSHCHVPVSSDHLLAMSLHATELRARAGRRRGRINCAQPTK